jgi:type VI secretion system secreted protein VgrG
MALNQSNRLVRMTRGPLEPEEVVVTSFSGREAISQPFDFEIDFISTRLDLKPGDLIGSDVTIEVDRHDCDGRPLPPRYFHGYFNRFAAGEVVMKEPGEHKYRRYRAGVVPWLWFLSKTARCHVFFPEKPEKSILEVIQAVIDRARSDLHVNAVTDLAGICALQDRKVKHCVQYRETDLNFISRTLEQYGVFYYFKFEDGKHTLVLDMKKNYPICVEAEVKFPGVTGTRPFADHITDWQHAYRFVSGKWSHTDYNFEQPSTPLEVKIDKLGSVDVPGSGRYEVYDYPGEYATLSDGDDAARIRQEEEEVSHDIVEGASTCRTFTAGHKFTLTTRSDDETVPEHDTSYLLTSIQHFASQPSDDTGDAGDATYRNHFTCIADSVQFRPPRITPRPVISGVQTAVVVGPPGKEIYTDDEGYGRVKVQFHWDREGKKKKDGNTSCWIRVSHPWAGKGWGAVATPRVGQEVIVDFLEGDPDQPIIVGRVYNKEQRPPFGFPAGAVISGIKSRTHLGDGYNELSFDDTAGNEKITIHAQHDWNVHVNAKHTETIDAGQEVMVSGEKKLTVDGPHHETVNGDRTMTATGTIDIHANAPGTYTSDVSLKLAVGGSAVLITPIAIMISAAGSMLKLDATGLSLNGVPIS